MTLITLQIKIHIKWIYRAHPSAEVEYIWEFLDYQSVVTLNECSFKIFLIVIILYCTQG